MIKHCRLYIFLSLFVLLACQKTSVYFQDNTITEDPNITFWDNYQVALSTYKLDTFATTGDSIWTLGSVYDIQSGRMTGTSYGELGRPADHPFLAENIIMDSAVLFLVPNGNYYGDTTQAYHLNVYRLSENLGTDTAVNITYYNTNSTPHETVAIGSVTTFVHPQNRDTVFIRLADDFARDLYNHMHGNTEVMSSQATFRSYCKGICIEPDSLSNKAMYQFAATGSAAIIRYYYTEKGLYNVNRHYDISYLPSKQYNNLRFNYSGSPFSVFSPLKSSLVNSNATNDKAFLNNFLPSLVKVEFPGISNIKSTYPYVKVMRAELEIRVDGSLNAYPYVVPPQLVIYVSNQNNELSSVLLADQTGAVQTGNLVINPTIPEGTRYTFDITSYITTILNEGDYSKKALFLSPYEMGYNSPASRLVLSAVSKDPDIRLKLYVLGL